MTMRGTGNAKTALRWTAIALGTVIFLLVLVYALIPATAFKGPITRAIQSSTGRHASIDGAMEFHRWSWSPALVIGNLRVQNPDWAHGSKMLDVKKIEVSVHIPHLLRGQVLIPSLEIDEPHIDLERTTDGRASWEPEPKPNDAKPTAAVKMPVIKRLILRDGSLEVADGIRKLTFDGAINIDENSQAHGGRGFFMNGTGKLNDKVFKMTVRGAPLINVQRDRPFTFDSDVTAGDLHLVASNSIARPFDFGNVASKFRITGKDLANVFYLTGLALPNTPPFALSGTLDRDHSLFTVRDFRGKLGSSDIEGALNVQIDGARPKLTAHLTSQRLDIADLAAPLGSGPRSSEELGNAERTAAEPNTDSNSKKAMPESNRKDGDSSATRAPDLLLPDADLLVNRVRGMDADVTFEAKSVLTQRVPLNHVSFHLMLDDGLLQLRPLTFVLPQGKLAGNVAINARGSTPVTDIDMRLSEVDLGQFKPKAKPGATASAAPLAGSLIGRAQIHGAGSSIHKLASNADGDLSVIIPHGEIRTAFAELTGINVARGLGLLFAKDEERSEIRCGVANFRADNGLMNAKTIVIDTQTVLISAKGHVNFRNEEIDMSLRGQPKRIRLVRLRSPITVGGTLSKPRVGIQADHLLAQAGAATALGVLLTPVAAVIAFVDPGLAKNADCANVLADAASHQ